MTLAAIDFDFLIVLFWILVFFIGPIYKAIKQNKKSSSSQDESTTAYSNDEIQEFYDENFDDSNVTSIPTNTTKQHSMTKSLRELVESLNVDQHKPAASLSADVVTPPSLPKKTKHKKSKLTQKLESIKAADSNEGKIKTSYKIKSKQELRKAVVWSEILNQKYN